MKGKTKNCDLWDIGGTNIIPISSLAFRIVFFIIHPWFIPGHLFSNHGHGVVIAKVISRE